MSELCFDNNGSTANASNCLFWHKHWFRDFSTWFTDFGQSDTASLSCSGKLALRLSIEGVVWSLKEFLL